jgi:hypothetical protein
MHTCGALKHSYPWKRVSTGQNRTCACTANKHHRLVLPLPPPRAFGVHRVCRVFFPALSLPPHSPSTMPHILPLFPGTHCVVPLACVDSLVYNTQGSLVPGVVVAFAQVPFSGRSPPMHTHTSHTGLGDLVTASLRRPGLQPDAQVVSCPYTGGATPSSSPHDPLLACLLLGVSLPRPGLCLHDINTSTIYAYLFFMLYSALH